jgi:hypothetical protein
MNHLHSSANLSTEMRRSIDYAAVMAEDGLTEALYVRVSKADREALDHLAERLPLKAASIARIALRIGLAEIERDPSRIFGTPKGKTKR